MKALSLGMELRCWQSRVDFLGEIWIIQWLKVFLSQG